MAGIRKRLKPVRRKGHCSSDLRFPIHDSRTFSTIEITDKVQEFLREKGKQRRTKQDIICVKPKLEPAEVVTFGAAFDLELTQKCF